MLANCTAKPSALASLNITDEEIGANQMKKVIQSGLYKLLMEETEA